jgi:hypothetical protein
MTTPNTTITVRVRTDIARPLRVCRMLCNAVKRLAKPSAIDRIPRTLLLLISSAGGSAVLSKHLHTRLLHRPTRPLRSRRDQQQESMERVLHTICPHDQNLSEEGSCDLCPVSGTTLPVGARPPKFQRLLPIVSGDSTPGGANPHSRRRRQHHLTVSRAACSDHRSRSSPTAIRTSARPSSSPSYRISGGSSALYLVSGIRPQDPDLRAFG